MLKTALILLLITVLWSVIIAFLEGIGGLLDRIMKLIRKVSEKSSNKLRAYLGKKKFPAIPNIDPRLEHKVKVGLLEGEILRFKNYLNPEPTFNGSLPYPAWEAPKYQLPVRQHIPTKSIFIGDLQTILTPNAITIKARIQSLLSLPHDFPERSPVSPLIQPPPQPLPYKPFDIEEPSFTLPEWAGIASFLNDFVKKEYASELWKTRKARERYHELIELEQKQRKELEKEKREAESRYQSAKVRLSAAYESQLQAYTSAKTTWDKQAAEERKTFASLLEQQNQLETIEEPTKLVISNIDFPTWMPTNFELQYDGAAQTIIVEHEFPNIEDLEFTKAVHLKTGIVKKPLNQKELKTVVDFFYPALCLRIAYESARQIQSPILKAVAVNGWANYKVK